MKEWAEPTATALKAAARAVSLIPPPVGNVLNGALSLGARSQNCGISVFEMLGRFGLGGQVWPYMHNSNQKSSNCNKEVAPKTCHFKQTICRLQKNLIFTQLFPFSSLNLWFTHVLSRKCRKWHLRALVGSFSLKSRMVGRLDNSGAGILPLGGTIARASNYVYL